jgi:hypothetical protein
MGHLLGDARVSTTDQHPQLQVDAPSAPAATRYFTETASGARSDPPSPRSWTSSAPATPRCGDQGIAGFEAQRILAGG